MAKSQFTLLKGLGQAQSIAAVLCREIEKAGGADEDAIALTTPDGEQFLGECARGWMDRRKPKFVPQPPKVVKTLPIRQRFKNTEAAIKAGRYGAGYDSYVSSRSYPLRSGMQEEAELYGLDMSESFDHKPSTAEIVALAEAHGFVRPIYEDALRVGAEHNGEQCQRPFAFLHDPVGLGSVLCLDRWVGGRRLDRRFGGPSNRWGHRLCVFFFRRPPAALPQGEASK